MMPPIQKPAPENQKIALPAVPALAVNAKDACLLSNEGELETVSHERAQMLVHDKSVLVCHAPYTRGRLGIQEFYAFDLLELFAFVHPAKFCVPTPQGLCRALGLNAPETL